MRRRTAVTVFILCLIAAGLLCKLFVTGEPIDGKQLLYSTSVEDSVLELQVSTAESAVALRGWKIWQEGDSLFLSARKVPVSFLFSSGDYQTFIELDGITGVYLGGRLIWEQRSGDTSCI